MTRQDWMRALADHFDRMRLTYPDDEFVLVFDIDGTIVDTRQLVVHVLLSYDRHHGTDHFRGITAADVSDHETRVDAILEPFALPTRLRRDVRSWYLGHFRDLDAVAASHRPYQGVLSVIRWFQLQPGTVVALNTGRPESMRELTLTCLNELGRVHRVKFDPELLFMSEGATTIKVAVADWKVDALRRLRQSGYRIVAVVDNEPSMIRAMAEADETQETLFLHADTIFSSRREPTPRTISGTTYGLAPLVDEAEVGRRVTLVWHGVNDRHNVRQFIGSDVRWAELDVRRDPLGRLVLRHDSFVDTPWTRDEELMTLTECLELLRWTRRSIKLDLKEDDAVIEALEVLASLGFEDEELWFNGSIESIGRRGFQHLRRARPGSVLQTPIDFLVPLLLAAPELAESILSSLRAWGLTRVSVDWRTRGARDALDSIEALGWEVNLYGIPDLESFLEAALLLPTSVTADFNFPAWRYDGRGPRRREETTASALELLR